jgi:hypothetical protein
VLKEISDFGPMVQPPKKGDPIYDLIGILQYCKEHNIDRSNGVPREIVEKFIIGYH